MTAPICRKCGVAPCEYYSPIGGFSVQCHTCNMEQSAKRRAASARRRGETPQPQPFYHSRLRPDSLEQENARLRSHRLQQRRAAAISYTALALSALLLGFVAWWLAGEAFLNWLTLP